MKYCAKCLLPSTKPYISFDDQGVCGACRAHEQKNRAESGIDWRARKAEFDLLVEQARSRKAPFFDALVPVSGGKDSISQVHRLLEYGIRILAVNVDYGIKTKVGRRNLDCIPAMGASLVIFRPELNLHTRIIRLGFEEYGDPDLLSHTLLHAYPLHVAMQFRIPLVLLGEDSAFEYSGESGASTRISREWFSRYAANGGRDARCVSEKYGIPFEKLALYDYPDALDGSDTRAVFCSHYFHWDSEENLRIARQYGFESLDRAGEGTYRNYVGIDEKINRIHQYFKVLKFGYGRATDHACEDIRNGRLTREAAKALVREHDLKPLSDDYIDDFNRFVGLDRERFEAVMERYRNLDVWHRDAGGNWTMPGHLEDGE